MKPNKNAREIRDARNETRRVELQLQHITQLLDRNTELESMMDSPVTVAQQQAHTATVTADTVRQLVSALLLFTTAPSPTGARHAATSADPATDSGCSAPSPPPSPAVTTADPAIDSGSNAPLICKTPTPLTPTLPTSTPTTDAVSPSTTDAIAATTTSKDHGGPVSVASEVPTFDDINGFNDHASPVSIATKVFDCVDSPTLATSAPPTPRASEGRRPSPAMVITTTTSTTDTVSTPHRSRTPSPTPSPADPIKSWASEISDEEDNNDSLSFWDGSISLLDSHAEMTNETAQEEEFARAHIYRLIFKEEWKRGPSRRTYEHHVSRVWSHQCFIPVYQTVEIFINGSPDEPA